MIDRDKIYAMAEYAEMDGRQRVLEIGAGLGMLTSVIAERAKRVWALEFDRGYAEYLSRKFRDASKVKTMHVDAVSYLDDLLHGAAEPESPFSIVSNLPYGITAPVLMKIWQAGKRLEKAVITVQYEPAARLTAKEGVKDRNSLSVLFEATHETEIIEKLPPDVFWPKPAVSSAVVRIRPLEAPKIKINDNMLFGKFVRGLFLQRRKMLRKVMKRYLKSCGKAEVLSEEDIFALTGIDANRRAETLSIEEFSELFHAVHGRNEGD